VYVVARSSDSLDAPIDTTMIGLIVRMTYKGVRHGMRISDAVKADTERQRTEQERLLTMLDPDQAQAVSRRIAQGGTDVSEHRPGSASLPTGARSGESWDISQSVAPPS
jgi:hypothetical protein